MYMRGYGSTTGKRSQFVPDDIWCAIPVYNNAATIGNLVERCRRQLTNVIVVDDGSIDADLRDLLKDSGIVVLRHEHNMGKGAALLTALRYVAQRQGRYLITLDGDGQHFPEDVPHFIAELAPDTILVGNRQQISGVMPRSSRFGREFSDFWIHVESGAEVRDTQSGFRAYPVGPILDLRLCSRHYNFEMEVLTRSIWAGLQVKNVPIRVWYPDASQRISSFRPFWDNLRISLLHARLVGRQLLPLPHRRVAAAPGAQGLLKRIAAEHATPLGLAAAAGLSLLLGSLPLPIIPIIVAFYAAMRLHLNKLVTLAVQVLCIGPLMPRLCIWMGRQVLRSGVGHSAPVHHWLEWLVGSLIIPPPVALALMVGVYFIARRFQPAQTPLATADMPKIPQQPDLPPLPCTRGRGSG